MASWIRSWKKFAFGALLFALVLLSSVVLARSLDTSLGPAPALHPPAAVSSDSWFFSSRSLELDRSRRAVAQFYKDHYVPYGKVQNQWSGSTNGCKVGRNSAEYDEATLQILKYYRAMAGVPADISFAEKYNGMARAAALMMEAKNDLSHGPGPNWPCYSDAGKSGAGSSNLCLGCVGPSAIDAYVQDAGVDGVGHRQWALHPQQKVLGTGSSSRAHALYVFGDWRPDEEVEQIKSVAWPPEGFVPYRFGLDSGYPWSYTSFAPDGDLSRAKVQMSRDGKNVSVRQEQGRKDLLVWYPTGLERATHQNNYNQPAGDVTIQVRISNVIIDGKATTIEYSVIFIDPDAVLSEEDSENTDPGIDSDADPGSEEGTDAEVQITIDPSLNGPMLQAIYQGNTKLALDLLSRGADPNARYQERWTALMYAAYYGHEDIVKELLRRGADASVQLDGWDARAMAQYQGHDSIAALIGKRTQSSPVPGRRAIRPPAP